MLAQALLAEPTFLADLESYDKDNIDPKIVERIKPFVADPNFEPEVVKKASKAAYGLCCWVGTPAKYCKCRYILPCIPLYWHRDPDADFVYI